MSRQLVLFAGLHRTGTGGCQQSDAACAVVDRRDAVAQEKNQRKQAEPKEQGDTFRS